MPNMRDGEDRFRYGVSWLYLLLIVYIAPLVACTSSNTGNRKNYTYSKYKEQTETSSSPVPAKVDKRAKGIEATKIFPSKFRDIRAVGDFEIMGMRFPEKLGRFTRSEITDYRSDILGYSVGYNEPEGIFVTVYLYGDGSSSEDEIKRVVSEMSVHAKGKFELVEVSEILTSFDEREVEGQMALGYYPERELGTLAIVYASNGTYLKYRVSGELESLNKRMDELAEILVSLGLPENN